MRVLIEIKTTMISDYDDKSNDNNEYIDGNF